MARTATPRIPNAPQQYSQMATQQILSIIQNALDELRRRGIAYDTQTTVGAAGTASALPANPEGYANVVISGEEYVIPYYKKA